MCAIKAEPSNKLLLFCNKLVDQLNRLPGFITVGEVVFHHRGALQAQGFRPVTREEIGTRMNL